MSARVHKERTETYRTEYDSPTGLTALADAKDSNPGTSSERE